MKKIVIDATKYLHPEILKPTFLTGFAKAFDIFGTYSGIDKSAFSLESDVEAMQKDWEAVGEDLYNAIGVFEQEHGIKNKSYDTN